MTIVYVVDVAMLCWYTIIYGSHNHGVGLIVVIERVLFVSTIVFCDSMVSFHVVTFP